MKEINVSDLKSIEVFHDVPDDQLEWLIRESDHYELQEGEMLSTPGQPITGTHVIFSGRIEIYRIQNNSKLNIADILPGSITGLLPFSRGIKGVAFGQCMETTQIMTLPKEKLRTLISMHYELTQALVIVMTSRVREFTELEQQNEKMMALGKLSAGLAHELNNPAAAIARGSVSLKKHLLMQPDTFRKLISIHLSPDEVDLINEKMITILKEGDRPALSMMKRAEKEDDLINWFDDNEIGQCDYMAENLVDFGISEEDLEDLKSKINKNDFSPVLHWINNNLVTDRMVGDIHEASRRIVDLVSSVKTFTHMDRGGEKEYFDIHNGIRNTLVMLNYKIKKGNVKVSEEFDFSLPHVKAMVGELNQVWTNLIDNALDALAGTKDAQLIVRTVRDKDFVKVSICDNGPGVPQEMRSRIFEPFFTTKSIGNGTGLGLDVVSRIVRQHHGSVSLIQHTEWTEFQVCFPING